MATRTIRVDEISRVEGQGALTVVLRDGRPADVRLRIFEPPRFFEALLRGRSRLDAPDITSRICGICPVAYQMSACHAIEDAAGVRIGGPIRALRRLLYCGEWIESHALHVFLLHLPDFLGHPDAISLARADPEPMRRGLRMKRAGNALIERIGGRAIHPVNVRVGGFHRAPRKAELAELLPELRWGRDAAVESVRWAARLPFAEGDRDYRFLALRHPDEYPFCEGRLASSDGLDLAVSEFESVFAESQVPWSTALHCARGGRAHLLGPLARLHLNADKLRPLAREAAEMAGIWPSCRNPDRSLLVRLVEIVQAFDEAILRIESYEPPKPAHVEVPERAGTGYGCTEAPRGSLYHRYTLDGRGAILEARIVPPTAQNQASMEDDLRAVAERLASLPMPRARELAEHAIRNHDPCISCATHFLTLRYSEEPCA